MKISHRASYLGLIVGLFASAPAFAQSAPVATAKPPAIPRTTAPAPNPAADMAAVLDAQAALGPKPIETLTPAEARLQPSPTDGAIAVMKAKGMPTEPDDQTVTQELSYGSDPMQKARIYKPAAAPPGLLLPIIVYYHGGGWVIANLDTYDATPRLLSQQLNAIVVSVEYRHAPEAKFPAQHQDAAAAYEWALQQASAWSGDPARVALAGESAGGNLAVATAIHARDKGLTKPVHILAVYPIANTNPKLESKLTNANAKPLNTPMLTWFSYYYSKSKADAKDTRLNLVKANLRGLPPVTIINAQLDPLLSDGETLAAALQTAQVPVEQRTFPGVTHEFFGMGKIVRGAYDAELYAVERLRPVLAAR